MTSQTPIEIVTAMLDAFSRSDVDAGMSYVAENIAYTNVSLPTVRGRSRVGRIFAGLEKPAVGFGYEMINVSADGATVLTERVDELRFGPVALQFWVCGRFEVRDAQIVVWRDYFDFFDMTKALVRGLAAVVIPGLQRPLPSHPAPAVS